MEVALNQNFTQLVAMFLAEILRSRKTSLRRAAEISQRVLNLLPKMRDEGEALSALTEIEKEFDEVKSLKQALNFGYKTDDIKVYEKEIKDYASKIFIKDMHMSSAFLLDAASAGMTIQELCVKYPDFCSYLFSSTEKGQLIPELKQA